MKKSDYVTKLDTMIDDGIIKGTYADTYVETTDNTLKELSRSQDFLYRNFHNYERYKGMKPDSNQPARLYGTASWNYKTFISTFFTLLKFINDTVNEMQWVISLHKLFVYQMDFFVKV